MIMFIECEVEYKLKLIDLPKGFAEEGDQMGWGVRSLMISFNYDSFEDCF